MPNSRHGSQFYDCRNIFKNHNQKQCVIKCAMNKGTQTMLKIRNNEHAPLPGHHWLQTYVKTGSEQDGKMKSNQANIVVKIEKQEAEMPELGRVQIFPNQGRMGGALHNQQDTKPVLMKQFDSNQAVQLPEAMQKPRAFLEQSLQTRSGEDNRVLTNEVQPQHFISPSLLEEFQNMEGDSTLLQLQALGPAPPGFGVPVQNLNKFSTSNQPSSKNSWPIPSTQLSMGPSSQVTNYLVEGSSAMRVDSSNRHPLYRKSGLLRYYISQLKSVARSSINNQPPNMANALHSAAYEYQGTAQNTCFPLPSVYCNPGLVHQAGQRTELQVTLNENGRLTGNTHLDEKSREFLETLSGMPTGSSSSRPYKRRSNPPLYSIRNKESDFHVDPILRAFVIAKKNKEKMTANLATAETSPGPTKSEES